MNPPSRMTADEGTAVSASGFSAAEWDALCRAVRWIRIRCFATDYLRRFVIKRLHQLSEPDLAARIETLSADEFEDVCRRLSEHQAQQPPLP
jgi:hypothetical protein